MDVRATYGYRASSVLLATNGGAPYDLVARGDRRTYADLLTPTSLVADAHAAGLLVTPYTFRAENTFLPTDYRIETNPADYGRTLDEDLAFMRAGVDGLFCDQPDLGVEARSEFNAE